MVKEKETFYLTFCEEETRRATKSKHFITKVMFICAVARRRYNPNTHSTFDWKIALLDFVTMQEAKRSSKNRPYGKLEMKIVTVTREVNTLYLREKIFPAIRFKLKIQIYTLVLVRLR